MAATVQTKLLVRCSDHKDMGVRFRLDYLKCALANMQAHAAPNTTVFV